MVAEHPSSEPPDSAAPLPVHWTATAREHLTDIHDYLARHSPQYARRVVDRITRRSQQLAQYPMAGSMVPELAMPQLRQVLEGPYWVVYHLLSDRIDVIAVFHGTRQSPWAE